MSYILEALKKSEQQKREREGETAADMTPLLMAQVTTEVPRLPLGLIIAAFVMIGLILVLGVWILLPDAGQELIDDARPATSELASSVTLDSQQSGYGVEKDGAQNGLSSASDEKAGAAQTIVLNTPPKPSYIKAVPADLANNSDAQSGVSALGKPPQLSDSAQTDNQSLNQDSSAGMKQKTLGEGSNQGEAKLPGVERRVLPPLDSLRKIPDLIISSHIYSVDRNARSVNMNGRSWYEGELVAPGVLLDQITATGILLDVDGFPFPVNRKNGWQSIAD